MPSGGGFARDRGVPRDLIFHFYRCGTGLNHFLRRRVRPAGIAVLIVIVVAAGLAVGNADTPVYLSFALACGLVIVGLSGLPCRRAKLSAVRELPGHATVGQALSYGVEIINHQRRQLRRFQLLEIAPDPRPDQMQFRSVREPGEATRNFFDRGLAWYRWNWLCESRRNFDDGRSPAVDRLQRAEGGTVTMTLTPLRRGLVRLNDLRVLLPDPLGLFQRCVKVAAASATLVVLPRRYALPCFELPGGARCESGGESVARESGGGGEFTGLRDYQSGDPLRLVHWPTWARTGRPVVKELEDEVFPRHGLVLDQFPRAGDEDLFEHAVSVAASFLAGVDARESSIELLFPAAEKRTLSAGRGPGRAEMLLEVLASVECAPGDDFEEVAQRVIRHADGLAGCLCVFAGWSDSRADLLRRLKRAGIEVAAIVVCRELSVAVPGCHFVRATELAADLQKLPREW